MSLKHFIAKLIFFPFESWLQIRKQQEKDALVRRFKKAGSNFFLADDYSVHNPQYVEIGDNFNAGNRFRIEAWDSFGRQKFTPKIKIGNNVIFNTDIHIGCINSIEIGDNCLFASRIYITDHHHGDTSDGMVSIPPAKRPLVSKGAVKLENNVWIGEGVAIMPGVTIGENSIIGTNAVVTKDIPRNSVAAGIPAKVIKTLGHE